MLDSLTMVVTQLNLEFRFQGKKLRGFSCELTRSPHGVFPETTFTITCQIVVPLLLSGLGMMTAGLVMNTIQVRTGHLRGSVGPGLGRTGVPRHHRYDRCGDAGSPRVGLSPKPGLEAQWSWQMGPPVPAIYSF